MEYEFKGLSRSFNTAVLRMAELCCPAGYDIQAEGPSTLDALNDHIALTGRISVYDGHSDKTIFGDNEANYAFRAWHDWTHWRLQADFDDLGEENVYRQQARHLLVHGLASPEHLALLRAEVIGQQCHKNKFGHCPEDQIGFVRVWLLDRVVALAMPW